jgi:glycosyltransferase involved in cell wall biosynthesis
MAVKSVLQQSFGDFELVISNGGSTDDTREVVHQFDDPRIKYLESVERLFIGDNYQAGLDHASGEYITFLSDDDAFVPQMLERSLAIIEKEPIEVLVFKSCFYFQEPTTYLDRVLSGNSLVVLPFSGKLTKFDGEDAARAVFGNFNIGTAQPNFNVSFLANAIYHQSVFSKISQRRPKLFEMTPADGYLAAAVAFAVDSYHCLDEPLHVWTNWAENATADAQNKKDGLRRHYENLLGSMTLDYVPLKFAMPLNCAYNALFGAKNDFDDADSIKVDWADYYFRIHEHLIIIRSFGVNVTAELDEWNSQFLTEPEELRVRVLSRLNSASYKLRSFCSVKLPTVYRVLKKIRQRTLVTGNQYFNGRNEFTNVLEGATFVGRLVADTKQYPKTAMNKTGA